MQLHFMKDGNSVDFLAIRIHQIHTELDSTLWINLSQIKITII